MTDQHAGVTPPREGTTRLRAKFSTPLALRRSPSEDLGKLRVSPSADGEAISVTTPFSRTTLTPEQAVDLARALVAAHDAAAAARAGGSP